MDFGPLSYIDVDIDEPHTDSIASSFTPFMIIACKFDVNAYELDFLKSNPAKRKYYRKQ